MQRPLGNSCACGLHVNDWSWGHVKVDGCAIRIVVVARRLQTDLCRQKMLAAQFSAEQGYRISQTVGIVGFSRLYHGSFEARVKRMQSGLMLGVFFGSSTFHFHVPELSSLIQADVKDGADQAVLIIDYVVRDDARFEVAVPGKEGSERFLCPFDPSFIVRLVQ